MNFAKETNILKTQRLIDMHVHTDNSPDGVHSPMYICEQAVQKNLDNKRNNLLRLADKTEELRPCGKAHVKG